MRDALLDCPVEDWLDSTTTIENTLQTAVRVA